MQDGTVTQDSLTMSNVFVKAFSSVFDDTVPSNPLQLQSHEQSMMEEFSVSIDGVLGALKNLNPNSSPGPDGIHPAVLIDCADVLALPFCFANPTVVVVSL